MWFLVNKVSPWLFLCFIALIWMLLTAKKLYLREKLGFIRHFLSYFFATNIYCLFFTILLLHINKRMRKPVDPFDLWKNASFLKSKEEKIVPSIFRAEVFFFSLPSPVMSKVGKCKCWWTFHILRLGECSKFKKFYRKKSEDITYFCELVQYWSLSWVSIEDAILCHGWI